MAINNRIEGVVLSAQEAISGILFTWTEKEENVETCKYIKVVALNGPVY